MDPVVVEEYDNPSWTHIINVEDIARQHKRSVRQLMAYLKYELKSAYTCENRLCGSYTVNEISIALAEMKRVDKAGRAGLYLFN